MLLSEDLITPRDQDKRHCFTDERPVWWRLPLTIRWIPAIVKPVKVTLIILAVMASPPMSVLISYRAVVAFLASASPTKGL